MDWLQSHKVAIGVTLAVSLGTVAVTYLYKRGRKQWKNVGTVSQLFIYPIKSTRGVGVKEMMCTRKGSHFIDQNVYDRSFMVIQSDGNMQTARAEPKLVLIATKVEDGILTLNAPGMPVLNVEIPINSKQAITCRVWGEETLGVDCGDEVSQWLSDFLKKEYRLVYHPQTHLRGITSRDPKYSKLNAKKGKVKLNTHQYY
ncbi:unnamed protein product [Clavelina lepadiformis]|uniref:Molybdenum cofactor sulfurase middle domain-containing protein n=1 Tax=Clavelina lepadiformis TaxID=159417 RepID=A0ABP0EWU4_CLALP